MKVFDFNIHLPAGFWGSENGIDSNNPDLKDAINSELNVSPSELLIRYQDFVAQASFLEGANVMIFNQNIFSSDMTLLVSDGVKILENTHFTFLLDPRSRDSFALVEECLSVGIKSFKYHSYVQRIDDALIPTCVQIAQFIQEKGGILCVDASYGTLNMYKYDNMKLICEIASQCKKIPIIVLHSGGVRVIEAMLAVLDCNNLYLETSLTLPLFLGSNIESDLAFAYKTISPEKIIYASDSPFVDARLSLDTAMAFFERNGFRGSELDKIFHGNAMSIFN